MSIRLCTAVVVLLLSACTTVSHTPLTAESSKQLQGKTIARTQYPTPDFTAFTAGKAAFAMIGAAAMISEGNSIVKENEIQDPALAIAQGLSDKLIAARSVTVVPAQRPAASDEVVALATLYPEANYLVDVKTIGWMFNYYPTDWSHYRVTYSARVRLIEVASKKVVAETMCQTVQGDDKNPPTKDQLLDAKAALLKDYLGKGASACVDVVSRDLLRI